MICRGGEGGGKKREWREGTDFVYKDYNIQGGKGYIHHVKGLVSGPHTPVSNILQPPTITYQANPPFATANQSQKADMYVP